MIGLALVMGFKSNAPFESMGRSVLQRPTILKLNVENIDHVPGESGQHITAVQGVVLCES